jgi:selenide,water dikinase
VAADAVPALPGVEELLRGDHAVAGGSRRNRAHAETFATFAAGVPEWRRRLVCDATTSGGLLAAVPPGAERLVTGTVVGRLTAGAPGTIAVR